jgi:hypothetical protein
MPGAFAGQCSSQRLPDQSFGCGLLSGAATSSGCDILLAIDGRAACLAEEIQNRRPQWAGALYAHRVGAIES